MPYPDKQSTGPVCLKGKHLVLELADGAGLLEADRLGGLLEGADHGRGAAEQNLDVVGGLGKPFLYAHTKEIRRQPPHTPPKQRSYCHGLRAVTWRESGGRPHTLIMSAVMYPTPPVQPSGGLSRT